MILVWFFFLFTRTSKARRATDPVTSPSISLWEWVLRLPLESMHILKPYFLITPRLRKLGSYKSICHLKVFQNCMLDRIRKAVIDRRICRLAQVNILNDICPKTLAKSTNLFRGLHSTSVQSVMVLILSISTKVRKLKHLSRITTPSPLSNSILQTTYKLPQFSPTQPKKKKSNPHSHFCIVGHLLELYFCFLS